MKKLEPIDIDERNKLAEAGIMTLDAAAEFLTLSRDAVSDLIADGELIGVQISERRRGVSKPSVHAYLAARFLVPDKNEVPSHKRGSERVQHLQQACYKRLMQPQATAA